MPLFRKVCSFPPQPLPLGAAGKDQVSFIQSALGAIVENIVVVLPAVGNGWDGEVAIVAVIAAAAIDRMSLVFATSCVFCSLAVEWGATEG